ncbi:Serine acetyltransferase [Chitinispirillum alkaliphilum]|nr:Serine acetyltransferase [Chitinispirillum alkaliphilum]
MNLTKWMNEKLPGIVDCLEAGIQGNGNFRAEDALSLAGRQDIYEILDDILAVLFPGYYSKEKVTSGDMNFYLADMLRHISFRLGKQVRDVYRYRCQRDRCEDCNCEQRAQSAIIHLIESLPGLRETLVLDIKAAKAGDPAVHYIDEIILSYPCIEAIATYRIAHLLYELDVPIIPRIMSERAHSRTGIDIHPGAKIGHSFFIDHGTGVVIGETCCIGNNVKIYQGVTLGAKSPFDREGNPRKGQKRHPDIEDDVIIYANATILGGKTVIGKGAVIGGNSWIVDSVKAGEHV